LHYCFKKKKEINTYFPTLCDQLKYSKYSRYVIAIISDNDWFLLFVSLRRIVVKTYGNRRNNRCRWWVWLCEGWSWVVSTYLQIHVLFPSLHTICSQYSIHPRHHPLLNACLRIPYCLLRPNPEINNYNMHDAIKQKPLFRNDFASGHLGPPINPCPELFIGSNSLHIFARILQ